VSSEDSHGRDQTDGASGDGKRSARPRGFLTRLGRFVGRQRVPLFLFAVAVLSGLATYKIYPRTPPVTVQGGVQRITVVGPVEPADLDINEKPNGHDGITLAVALRAPQPLQDPFPAERLVVAVTSPPSSTCPPIARSGAASGQAIACQTANGAQTLYYQFPQQPWVNVGSGAIQQYQYLVSETVTIPDVAANVAQDSQDIATSLPPVSVLHYVYTTGQPIPALTYMASPPAVDFGEQVANGEDYTWQGAVPVYTDGSDHWIYSSASSAPAALNPTLDNGTDLAVQNRNTTLIFVAGILLGIAGGALVSALQAVISRGSD
jgi:hypothetical protein